MWETDRPYNSGSAQSRGVKQERRRRGCATNTDGGLNTKEHSIITSSVSESIYVAADEHAGRRVTVGSVRKSSFIGIILGEYLFMYSGVEGSDVV